MSSPTGTYASSLSFSPPTSRYVRLRSTRPPLAAGALALRPGPAPAAGADPDADAGAEEPRHTPGQQSGDVLVAGVLVAEPRRAGEPLAQQERGLVGGVVVGVRQPERRHHHGRVDVAYGCLELVDDRRRPDPVVPIQVLVLDEVEPDGLRAELVQRVDIFP